MFDLTTFQRVMGQLSDLQPTNPTFLGPCLDMITETGEITSALQAILEIHKGNATDGDRNHVAEHVAAVIYSLAMLCNDLNINMEVSLRQHVVNMWEFSKGQVKTMANQDAMSHLAGFKLAR